MRRYLVWSIAFHTIVLTLGAVVAPMQGLFGTPTDVTIVSVGLVDFADPGRVRGGPKPPIPQPAEDEKIVARPDQTEELEKIKEPDKPKNEEKKKETKKTAEKPPKKDTTSKSPELASADTGISGTVSEGEGGGDIWGVETGANVNPYHRQGFATIRGNWRNPAVGPIARACIVKFRVKRTGEITNIEIDKKSGSDLFDRAALRAVQVTVSWQPFPRHWEDNEQEIYLEFQYRP